MKISEKLTKANKKKILDVIPTSWLDSLLTGDDAVINKGYNFNCEDIERLLTEIKYRIGKILNEK